MALQLNFTDPNTQALYPQAYARIDGIHLTTLNSGGGSLNVGIYATPTSAAALAAPIMRMNIVLTDQEAATLRQQGLALLYGILQARPDFAGAISV